MLKYVWICDLACLIYTNKRLPDNCLHIISSYLKNYKVYKKKKEISDYEMIEKSSHKKTKKLLSKVRIKRSFRWR
jgi:hypothetical protein